MLNPEEQENYGPCWCYHVHTSVLTRVHMAAIKSWAFWKRRILILIYNLFIYKFHNILGHKTNVFLLTVCILGSTSGVYLYYLYHQLNTTVIMMLIMNCTLKIVKQKSNLSYGKCYVNGWSCGLPKERYFLG